MGGSPKGTAAMPTFQSPQAKSLWDKGQQMGGMFGNLFDQMANKSEAQYDMAHPVSTLRPIARPGRPVDMPTAPVLPAAQATNMPAGTPTPSLFS